MGKVISAGWSHAQAAWFYVEVAMAIEEAENEGRAFCFRSYY